MSKKAKTKKTEPATFTVAYLRANLARVLHIVEQGNSVDVVKYKKTIARIVPAK